MALGQSFINSALFCTIRCDHMMSSFASWNRMATPPSGGRGVGKDVSNMTIEKWLTENDAQMLTTLN